VLFWGRLASPVLLAARCAFADALSCSETFPDLPVVCVRAVRALLGSISVLVTLGNPSRHSVLEGLSAGGPSHHHRPLRKVCLVLALWASFLAPKSRKAEPQGRRHARDVITFFGLSRFLASVMP
jgi:hypothetical protein